MILQPCGRCRRHVSHAEPACPFCGEPLAARGPHHRTSIGRLGRAAIFVGAAGCYTGSSPSAKDTTHETVSNRGSDATSAGDPALPPPTTGMATVGGRVIDADTGQPVSSATIQLIPASGPPQLTNSDAHGNYVFANIPPGAYQLTFRTGRSNPRMAPEAHSVELAVGKATRLDGSVSTFDPSNVPMPYGAPPRRRRVV